MLFCFRLGEIRDITSGQGSAQTTGFDLSGATSIEGKRQRIIIHFQGRSVSYEDDHFVCCFILPGFFSLEKGYIIISYQSPSVRAFVSHVSCKCIFSEPLDKATSNFVPR